MGWSIRLAVNKGISGSSIPYSRRAPTWLKTSTDEATELICKLAKKGLTPSQIGSVLRDSHGIGLVRVPNALGLAPQIPEDLYCLIKKAVAVRKHMERNRKDKDSKYRLILIESRIHRLARYYKRTSMLPAVWK
ncbi:Cytoplasmic ribosomal protein S13 [Paramicrosporidium saccamoebae]|uniref:Cytoplasmic ribosomal protein S13 n=1 Tax=Paramicrosporidium saccamoebae TaxID=1246581 RepID=A0A2H9TGW0_9FUNG|nr:Cytoplasmic ribosomal protein S13 [Paramicrosporidium saccamoebae]